MSMKEVLLREKEQGRTTESDPRKLFKKTEKTFAKPLDILLQIVYNINVALSDMREWRNWQTRTFEGRVVHTVRVQVPFLAPTVASSQIGATL